MTCSHTVYRGVRPFSMHISLFRCKRLQSRSEEQIWLFAHRSYIRAGIRNSTMISTACTTGRTRQTRDLQSVQKDQQHFLSFDRGGPPMHLCALKSRTDRPSKHAKTNSRCPNFCPRVRVLFLASHKRLSRPKRKGSLALPQVSATSADESGVRPVD